MELLTQYKTMTPSSKIYSFGLNNPSTLTHLRGPILVLALSLIGLAYWGHQINYHQFALSLVILLPGFIFNHFFSHLQSDPKHNIIPLGLDFLTSFLLIFVNGAQENPLYFIILLHIFIAPFYLEKKTAIVFILIITFSMMILPFSPYSFNQFILPFLPELNFPFIPLLLAGCIFGLFSLWLVKEINALNLIVENSIHTHNRIDRYRSLGLLTAGICHELGTPLHTIQMRLKQLYKKTVDQDQNPFEKDFEVLLRNSQKCSSAIHKLNQQTHSDEFQLTESCLPYKTLESSINEFLKHSDGSLNISLNYETINIQETPIAISELLYTRCLLEVFENAKDAGANEIKIDLKKAAHKMILLINDNGSGFNSEVLKYLGGPFVSSKQRGSGLGLYQIQNSLEYIGGKFKILSTSSQGSLLQMEFPHV